MITLVMSNLTARATTDVKFHVQNTTEAAAPHWFVQGGIPFPRRLVSQEDVFRVTTDSGELVESSVKLTGYWPDGSVKWVLVRMQPPLEPQCRESFVLHSGPSPGDSPVSRSPVAAQDDERIWVNTGVLSFEINRTHANLFNHMERIDAEGKTVVLDAREDSGLFVVVNRRTEAGPERTRFEANADMKTFSAELEEADDLCAVIKLKGTHVASSGDTFAPYVLRIYAYRNSSRLRLVHFFVYDGQPKTDFLANIGVCLALKDGNARGYTFGVDHGVGVSTPYLENGILPSWRFGCLSQDSAQHFAVRKAVNPATNSMLAVQEGRRSQGWAALVTDRVRLTAGIRNFWQEYPKAISVDASERVLTAHFYSPYAGALDLRRYSSLRYPSLYEAPMGDPNAPAVPFDDDTYSARYIGKSTELFLDFAPPSANDRDSASAMFLFQDPPLLQPSVQWIAASRVFGDYATAGDTSHLEEIQYVAECADFYIGEQDYRNWYSFTDYGDVMHSFDLERDTWCFDQGGYAWCNNEGLICEGLWSAYLMLGDARVYRFAEAMTHHVQDVDMHHDGPYAACGSRHNVNHWGCMARQHRMTIPFDKRIYYFLSGDEATCDRVHFIYDTMARNPGECDAMDLGVGAAALLFLWETTGDAHYGDALQASTEAFCGHPIGKYAFPTRVTLDFRTGTGSIPDSAGPFESFFLVNWGPMEILLDSYELTRSEKVRAAILHWAELLLMASDAAQKEQPYFATRKGGQGGPLSNIRVALFAYRETKDVQYLGYVRNALKERPAHFENVGGTKTLEAPSHRVIGAAKEAESDPERFQTLAASVVLHNYPIGLTLLSETTQQAKDPSQ